MVLKQSELRQRMERILFSEDEIQCRVDALAQAIAADYIQGNAACDEEARPVLMICILRGALLFMSDLAQRVPMAVEYDTISVSSYASGTVPGAVQLVKDLERPIAGRDVLVVEDIIDTGYTIEYLRRTLEARQPASVRVATLIDKVARREIPVGINYVGFPLEQDAFVVGYGMDYAELYRNLPYIGVLKPEYIRE